MTIPPEDLPRSPSGRVPQWVIDEAAGRATVTTSWRTADPRHTYSPTDLSAPLRGTSDGGFRGFGRRRPPRRRVLRRRTVLAPTLVLAMLAGLMWIRLDSADMTLADVFNPPDVISAVPAARTPWALESFPPEGVGEAPAPLATPPPIDGSSGSYAFIDRVRQPDGSTVPVSWSPCRPVQVVLNPEGAPEGFVDTLTEALAELSALTGLVLTLEGATDEPPGIDRLPYQPERYGERWAPVLVAFASEKEVPDLAGKVAGVASSVPIGRGARSAPVYMTGSVHIDVTTKSRGWLTPPAVYREVLLHELAHLLGLDHVEDPTQLMNPELSQSSFQAGDRAGLAQLGSGRCAPDL